MPLIPLNIPAGVYRTGTDFQQSGRWRDSSLVRWHGGSMRPVGGWREKSDISASVTAAPRAFHVWIDNTSAAKSALGTANELLYVTPAGQAFDITPTGFTTGSVDATINTGFGGGYFGDFTYGTSRASTGEYTECDTWSIDNWGEYLVACSTSDGKIYEWQLNTSTPAAVVTNAPTGNKGIFVTEERFLFALQSGGNPRKISWCDREDNTNWTPDATNEAGDIELQTNGEIMTAVRMRGRTLILTSSDAHIATYQGAPFVYGFERVGTACGSPTRHGLIAIDQGAFWIGKEAFYYFDGSVAKQMSCDVQDYVFEDMNKNQISKVYAVHNGEYGEIWWFYPSASSTECDSYVAYDYIENHWEIGRIDRVCGADQGIFKEPIWIDATGVMYEHEIHGAAHGTQTPFVESGPIVLGNGDTVMKVNQLIGDETTAGEVQVKFKTRFHPNDTERTYPSSGAYDLTNIPTSVRFTGRQVRLRVEATGNEDWRVGTMRINAETGGRR